MIHATKRMPGGAGLATVLVKRAPTLELDWDTRSKSRFSATDSTGREIGAVLPRGTLLRGGDVLVTEGGTLLRFTHDEEAEADAVGLPFSVAAGYDPNGMVRFFERLKKQSGNTPQVMSWLSDHPLPQERIVAAKQRIARMHHPPRATNTARFQKMQARLH